MKSDRKLLELAAKAAGLQVEYDEVDHRFHLVLEGQHPDTFPRWNPRADDGDALRLAVALGLKVEVYRTSPLSDHPYPCVEVRGYAYRKSLAFERADDNGASLLDATRRAILLAAAGIGEITP
jgi:hypothetical protein